MNAEKMLLEDALRVAIKSERKLLRYKTLIYLLLGINIALVLLCIAIAL